MLSIQSMRRFGAFAALVAPVMGGAIGEASMNYEAETNISLLPISRPLAPSSVFKELRPGVFLRADIVPQDSTKEVVVLAGAKIYSSNAKELLSGGIDSIYSGTFFAHNISMGDIVGYSIKDPQLKYAKSFGWGEKNKTGRSIHNRFYFGIRRTGEIEIQRRSELKDGEGKLVAAGAELSSEFQSFLGGLARIEIDNESTRKALLDGNQKVFVHQFNLDNRNYNRKAAYDGLDGSRTRPRSGIVLCEHAETGSQVVMPLSIGNGRSELKGVTIFGFARHALFVAESKGLIVHSIALADGGGSVSYYGRVGGVSISSRPPSTAFAVKERDNLLVKR